MRKTRTIINSHRGYDYRYSVHCDICGEFLTNNVNGREGYGKPAEFLSCGEEWIHALTNGWIGDHDTIICPKCLKSIGK